MLLFLSSFILFCTSLFGNKLNDLVIAYNGYMPAAKEVMEEELQKKKNEIDELRKQLEREAMVMSKEMREEKEREGRIKLNDFKTLQKKYIAKLKESEKKFLNVIRDDVSEIVERIGKKEGYLLIVNSMSVLYAPTSIDITDQLIKEYNLKFAKLSQQ